MVWCSIADYAFVVLLMECKAQYANCTINFIIMFQEANNMLGAIWAEYDRVKRVTKNKTWRTEILISFHQSYQFCRDLSLSSSASLSCQHFQVLKKINMITTTIDCLLEQDVHNPSKYFQFDLLQPE